MATLMRGMMGSGPAQRGFPQNECSVPHAAQGYHCSQGTEASQCKQWVLLSQSVGVSVSIVTASTLLGRTE